MYQLQWGLAENHVLDGASIMGAPPL
jgi:hypothetical protein